MLCSSNTCFHSNFFEDLVCTRQVSLILSPSFSFSLFLISFSLSLSLLPSKHSHLILSLTLSLSHSHSHSYLSHANWTANMRKHAWKCSISVLIHDAFHQLAVELASPASGRRSGGDSISTDRACSFFQNTHAGVRTQSQ